MDFGTVICSKCGSDASRNFQWVKIDGKNVVLCKHCAGNTNYDNKPSVENNYHIPSHL